MDPTNQEKTPDNSLIEEVDEVPMGNSGNYDSRINITNTSCLRKIVDITVDHVKDLADTLNLKDKSSEFISLFSESFKDALQENIVVNGLPLKLSRKYAEDHPQMVDDALCSNLCKKVADVASSRKYCTENCKRIYKVQMKHDLVNLRKAKVRNASADISSQKVKSQDESSRSSTHRISRSFTAANKHRSEEFVKFCTSFNTVKETVQCRLQERDIMLEKIRMAKRIQNQSSNSPGKRKRL